jgi:hypothetical protein
MKTAAKFVDLLSVIEAAHVMLGDDTATYFEKKVTCRKYANITTATINFFLSVYEVCSTKEAKKK